MGQIPKRTFENELAEIEVGGHTSDMAPGQIVDKLFIATILDGNEKDARELFGQVAAKYEQRPVSDWLED